MSGHSGGGGRWPRPGARPPRQAAARTRRVDGCRRRPRCARGRRTRTPDPRYACLRGGRSCPGGARSRRCRPGGSRPRGRRRAAPGAAAGGALLGEHVGERVFGERMGSLHGFRLYPPREHLLELLDALELATVEKVLLDEPEWAFLLSLVTGHPPGGDVHGKAVVGGEIDEAHVQDRPTALPAIDHPGHGIGDALKRDAAEALEASLQAPEDRRLAAVVPGLERP